MTGQPDLPAGTFSVWLGQIGRPPGQRRDADVPCGSCTGCCTSSQFIHIGADETRTLALIPRALLFPAPGLPKGNVVLGYDERGHCPMFVDARCSIYEDRPRTCRAYDCRVFPAAGLELDDDDKAEITARTRRWRFDFPAPADRTRHAAVRAAAAFLRDHARNWEARVVPRNPTQLAVLAIGIHEVFLAADAAGELTVVTPSADVVEAAVLRVTADLRS